MRLNRLGWTTLFHDVRIFGVQIDLVMRTPTGVLTLVEVKGGGRLAHVSWSQRRRLLRACEFLASWEPVELAVALWEGGEVLLLPADALTGR